MVLHAKLLIFSEGQPPSGPASYLGTFGVQSINIMDPATWQISTWVGSPKKPPHKSPQKSVFPEFHERFWDLWGAFSGWTNPSGKLAQQHLCWCMRHKKVKNVQCQICVQTNCRTKLTFLKDCNSRSWELLCASHIHAVYFIFTTCTNNKNNINLSYIMISYGDSKYLQHISTIKTQYNIL